MDPETIFWKSDGGSWDPPSGEWLETLPGHMTFGKSRPCWSWSVSLSVWSLLQGGPWEFSPGNTGGWEPGSWRGPCAWGWRCMAGLGGSGQSRGLALRGPR